MLIKTNNRTDAIHALINMWLKDIRLYCNECGRLFVKEMYPCCEDPYLIDNLQAFQMLQEEIKMFRNTRQNEFASTPSKSMRWGVRIPQTLLRFLDTYFQSYGEKGVFRNKNDMNQFMKKFKQFTIPERV